MFTAANQMTGARTRVVRRDGNVVLFIWEELSLKVSL